MSTASSSVSPTDGQRVHVSQGQRTAEAKAAFIASLTSVGSNLDTDLQARAKDIHTNSKALEKQEKELQKETKKLAKQSDVMQKLVDKTKNELKEFDGMPDLMADLDRDLAMLEETLRLVEHGDCEDVEDNDVEGNDARPDDQRSGHVVSGSSQE